MNQARSFPSLLGLLGASLFAAACSGGDGETSSSVIGSCQGAYVCVIDASLVDSGLVKTSTGRC